MLSQPHGALPWDPVCLWALKCYTSQRAGSQLQPGIALRNAESLAILINHPVLDIEMQHTYLA